MTALQDSLREQIATAVQDTTLKTRRRGFRPARHSDFKRGRVLAFDQTLTKTGWSMVEVSDRIRVLDSGMIKVEIDSGVTSHERSLAKADVLHDELLDLLERKADKAEKIIYESPAVFGHRTESSLMGAMVLRLVCRRLLRVPMPVHRQRVLATYLGPGTHEKRDVTAAVNALVASEDRRGKNWNQDVHDSVLLGLGWLDKRSER